MSYSVQVDDDSLIKLLGPIPKGYQGIVCPAVTEGIDWDMFRKKVKDGEDEPVSQMGLNFDTDVEKRIDDNFWTIKSTTPKVWVIDCKAAIKSLRDRKGEGLKIPTQIQDLFTKLKVCAFVKARVLVTYTHECLGNILETAGVTSV